MAALWSHNRDARPIRVRREPGGRCRTHQCINPSRNIQIRESEVLTVSGRNADTVPLGVALPLFLQTRDKMRFLFLVKLTQELREVRDG